MTRHTRFYLVFLSVFSIPLFLFSQNKDTDILLKIEGNPVTTSEFLRIYEKNNTPPSKKADSLEDYLDLFINFKLKVLEAERRGLDTTQSFKKELNRYRDELAKSYLKKKPIVDSLLKESYRRKKRQVNVSHILIKIDKNASPQDTAKAYNQAMSIRRKIIDGESFQKLARRYSDDPSQKKNKGKLGYIEAFQTVYPFESAAYSLDSGEISKPVRTKYGYHIIKNNGFRKNPGQVKVAHIMLAKPKNTSQASQKKLKDSIFNIYNELDNGADFAKMARKHSADKRSARNGGVLPWFKTGKMIPAFENVAFSLEEKGAVSKPLKTEYGWHIIKLIDKKKIGSFGDKKQKLKQQLRKSGRMDIAKEKKVNELKEEYQYKQVSGLESFFSVTDTSGFDIAAINSPDEYVFSLADTAFTNHTFAKYINKNIKDKSVSSPRAFVKNQYAEFVRDKILKYEKKRLEQEYPEFRHLMQEYKNGILLFNLTDKLVWSKAANDTASLKKYYEKHKENYRRGPKLKATTYTYQSNKCKRKLRRYLRRKERKNYEHADIIKKLSDNNLNAEIVNELTYTENDTGYVATLFDEHETLANISDIHHIKKDNKIVYIDKKIPSGIKSFKEAKGVIIADYQNKLEKDWEKELRDKYDFQINRSRFQKLKENYDPKSFQK